MRRRGIEGVPLACSRFTVATLGYADAWENEQRLLDILLEFGTRQAERPVLYYETASEMLLVSRHQQPLKVHFRFLVPEIGLALDLVDKARFARLAERIDLPVPRTQAGDSPGPAPR